MQYQQHQQCKLATTCQAGSGAGRVQAAVVVLQGLATVVLGPRHLHRSTAAASALGSGLAAQQATPCMLPGPGLLP